MEGILVTLVILILIAIFTDRAHRYIPRGWHFTGPASLVTFAFAVLEYYRDRYYGSVWMILAFVNTPLVLVAYYWSKYIYEAGVSYQKYINGEGRPTKPAPAEKPTFTEPTFTPVNRGLMAVEKTVTSPTMNKERSFAISVVRMYEFDPTQVNLTESKWVKSGKFGRDEFKEMLAHWESFGLIARKDPSRKNSPYIVKSIEGIRLIANGHPLPRGK